MNDINALIAVTYVVAAIMYRNYPFLMVAVVTVIVLFSPLSFFSSSISVIHMQVLYSILYATMAIALIYGNNIIQAWALICMIVYMLMFSLDTWVNSNAETWIYINHESIVICLHAIILLSFSKKLPSLVGTCATHIRDICNRNRTSKPDVPSFRRNERATEVEQ